MKVLAIILALSVAGYCKPVPEYPAAKVKELITKIKIEKKLCSKPLSERPVICRSKKLMSAMEGLLVSYLAVQDRADSEAGKNAALKEKNSYLEKQTQILHDSIKAQRSPAQIESNHSCLKKIILDRTMIGLGITENGGFAYSKRPAPGGSGECWTNSKKKKGMTVNFCEYPYALSLETKGGSERFPTEEKKEYLFSINGCDLLSVFVHQSRAGKERETFLSYDQCMVQWNKRTADATMKPLEVARMEDTIGFCFRENLLPPRIEKNGRLNPSIPRPPNPNPGSKSEVNPD